MLVDASLNFTLKKCYNILLSLTWARQRQQREARTAVAWRLDPFCWETSMDDALGLSYPCMQEDSLGCTQQARQQVRRDDESRARDLWTRQITLPIIVSFTAPTTAVIPFFMSFFIFLTTAMLNYFTQQHCFKVSFTRFMHLSKEIRFGIINENFTSMCCFKGQPAITMHYRSRSKVLAQVNSFGCTRADSIATARRMAMFGWWLWNGAQRQVWYEFWVETRETDLLRNRPRPNFMKYRQILPWWQ